jgi:hypothetical protein
MSLLLKLGLFAAIFGSIAICPSLHAQGLTFVLCAPGDPTPAGDDTIDFPGSFAESETGAVFMGHLQQANLMAVFSAGSLGTNEVVRVGDAIPGGGVVTGLAGNITTNNQSQALVYCIVKDVNNLSQSALLAGNSFSNLRTVVITGQSGPNGGQFTDLSTGSINDLGDVSFSGAAGGSSGAFVASHDGTISLLAANGQSAPGESYPFDGVGGGTINDNGQVLLSAEIDDTHYGSGSNYGIYSATSANDIIKIARSYDPAPSTPYLVAP